MTIMDLLTPEELIHISGSFCINGKAVSVMPIGNGHINDTYLIRTDKASCDAESSYVLQRINDNVFRWPDLLMENVAAVTEYMQKIRYDALSADQRADHETDDSCAASHTCIRTPSLISTRDGEYYYRTDSGFWRMMTYIGDAIAYEKVDDPEVFCEIGRGYGAFLSALSGFPAARLHETIEGFHDTRSRYEALLRACDTDAAGRMSRALPEIHFALEHEKDVDVLGDLVKSGAMPVRVTHNDTKINNVMIGKATGKAEYVIDLDTVMPGLAVNDFGDAIRSGASTGREDEADTEKIGLDMDMYLSYARGFMEGFPGITDEEIRMLPVGAKVMTLECGIRFLTDYLEGDRYFKTDHPEHNLIRCRAQFRLVRDMEEKWDKMQSSCFSLI